MFGYTLFCRSTIKATKYYYYKGEPYFTFLLNILRFLSRFLFKPVVVDTV